MDRSKTAAIICVVDGSFVMFALSVFVFELVRS
jgi:hypothetical protein